jgi:hypothetical protein
MCDPATAALVLTAVGGTMSAYGQYQSGKYQEKVAKNNAIIQGRMAEDALKRGQTAEDKHRDRVAQFKSQQAAKMGAAGIDLGVGSATDLLADTAMMGELDALTIRSNAQREAYGHDVQAQNYLSQGELAKSQGTYGAISTLLTTAGSAAASWGKLGGGTTPKPTGGMQWQPTGTPLY